MTIKWAPSGLDHYSHAIPPLAQHPVGVLEAECGHPLPPGLTLDEDTSGLRCPQCLLELLARTPGAPAAACPCPAAQDNACLRARLCEFIELAEAPGLWANQLTTLARQARSDLTTFRARQLAELATRWIAAPLPDPGPAEDGEGT